MSSHNYRSEGKGRGNESVFFNEMSNFIDVNSSYSDFVTNAAILNGDEAVFEGFDSNPKYMIQSRREIGLNVFYQVSIVRPRGHEFQVAIPWRAQEVCQHCQGQGIVYTWNSDNSAYEGADCDECAEHLEDLVGSAISEQDAKRLMVSLQERDIVTARERLLIEVALRNQEEQGRVLFDLPPYKRDTMRANLLRRILVSLAMA